MVHEGNKDEADKCFEAAQKYFENGERDKALKFALKSQKLYPTESCNDFVDLLRRLNSTSKSENTFNSSHKKNDDDLRQRNTQKSTPPTSRSNSTSRAEYTQDQIDAVKKVKKCKDFYAILNVSKEATDSELKKAYRKLALQFHPDKNKAPGADEAFKAVGRAFSVLTDVEKRKNYDLYGPEEFNSAPSRSTNHRTHYSDFEDNATAEELFNMFFGGGYPGTGVYVRRSGGRWEQPRRHRGFESRHQHQEQTEQSNATALFQLLPLLLILVLSLASSLFTADPVYSLSPNSKYNVVRTTRNLGISFYVKSDFPGDYQGSIRRLEQQVEEDYITTLRNNCIRERNYKESLLARARFSGQQKYYRQAYDARTPSCDTLNDFYSN